MIVTDFPINGFGLPARPMQVREFKKHSYNKLAIHAYIQLYHIQKLVCGVKGGLPHSGLKAALSPPQQWSAHEMNVTISTNNFIPIASDDFAGNCIEPMYGTPARYKVFYRILPGYWTITLPIWHVSISSANELQDVVEGVFADFRADFQSLRLTGEPCYYNFDFKH